MSALWVAIVAVALASAAIKAAGPVLVGGRELPPRANAVIALLAPALLAALVVGPRRDAGVRRNEAEDRPA